MLAFLFSFISAKLRTSTSGAQHSPTAAA